VDAVAVRPYNFDMSRSHLNDKQLAELRAALDGKRSALLRDIAAHARPAGDTDEKIIEPEELAGRDADDLDAQSFAERAHRLLGEVDAALARMDAGTYGKSEKSGEPIPYRRLRAVPWARTDSDEAPEDRGGPKM
jgi:RNA polymerase-binding transcription factor